MKFVNIKRASFEVAEFFSKNNRQLKNRALFDFSTPLRRRRAQAKASYAFQTVKSPDQPPSECHTNGPRLCGDEPPTKGRHEESPPPSPLKSNGQRSVGCHMASHHTGRSYHAQRPLDQRRGMRTGRHESDTQTRRKHNTKIPNACATRRNSPFLYIRTTLQKKCGGCSSAISKRYTKRQQSTPN